MYAKSFRDLEVYQLAFEVARLVFEYTKSFPKEEAYSLTDQFRRSSRSVGAQIAEAWAKRRYPRHFVSKLTDADAEQLETQHWVAVAQSCEYLDRNQVDTLEDKLLRIGRMLYSMMSKATSFCGENTVREEAPGYAIEVQTVNPASIGLGHRLPDHR